MDKKIIAGILLFCGVVILSTVVPTRTPAPEKDSQQFLPWQINHNANGNTRVFGITLGESTLVDFEHRYHLQPQISLFVSADKRYKVEAYYDKVMLGGFSARMVMLMELDQVTLAEMAGRGSRISNLGDGRKKITLSAIDRQFIMQQPIASMTYLTRTRLNPETLGKRFGQPQYRIQEADSDINHWLYPKLGLDIAINTRGHSVLQYVSPKQFQRLLQPLTAAATESANK